MRCRDRGELQKEIDQVLWDIAELQKKIHAAAVDGQTLMEDGFSLELNSATKSSLILARIADEIPI
jgi:hypothetical protein